VASTSTAGLALAHGRDVRATLEDQQRFEEATRSPDPLAALADADPLGALRGKDVLLVFVESYGQVALEHPDIAPGITAVLRDGTTRLAQAGLETRSAYLDSPIVGGGSWMAHATLQSGLWIDNQPHYDQVVASDRLTLSGAFGQAGWRTVGVYPANDKPWPEGASFYDLDQLYGRFDFGYQGPAFSWSAMPDQYALDAFQRLELAPGHPPLMAEVDLTSSHQPWTPLPRMVPREELGDGSVFDPMPAQGLSVDEAWRDTDTVRRLYGESIEYSLEALFSWLADLHDDNLVVVLLGDHQPLPMVTGPDATHHVPISFVTSDAAVLDRIDAWNWQQGLLPGPTAPVWPMDAFRDRFIETFTSTSGAQALGHPR
jgi:hypothetical protein